MSNVLLVGKSVLLTELVFWLGNVHCAVRLKLNLWLRIIVNQKFFSQQKIFPEKSKNEKDAPHPPARDRGAFFGTMPREGGPTTMREVGMIL